MSDWGEAGCTSEEHIIPESLGNVENVLPPGWVCDACNNYISREVEAPFLNSHYGRSSRFEMLVPSKRGRIPPVMALHAQSGCAVNLHAESNGGRLSLSAARDRDRTRIVRALTASNEGSLCLLPAGNPPAGYSTSRFVAKVALEVLAYWFKDVPGSNQELVDKVELDELRAYVRRGRPGFVWPVHMRRIYAADRHFTEDASPSYQVLHEWSILTIPTVRDSQPAEYYAIIAIFGVEYAINVGGPEIDGYIQWLRSNEDRSHLYPDRPAPLP